MPTAVTLYFAPYPDTEAVGLQIEESPDGLDPWTQITDTDQIGTYPNWISSFVAPATSIDYWFRIRWELEGGLFTPWSDPVLGSALPYHWTVPDLYRSVSVHDLTAWSAAQLQLVIDRAYYMLQDECGPYDESVPGFSDVAQMSMHILMDRLVPAMSRQGASIGAGMQEEEMGSYRYRRGLTEAIDMAASALVVPVDLISLLCPYGSGARSDFGVETTHVFQETAYTLSGSNGRTRVFTTDDRNQLAPHISPWPWWNAWGHVHHLGE